MGDSQWLRKVTKNIFGGNLNFLPQDRYFLVYYFKVKRKQSVSLVGDNVQIEKGKYSAFL